jgi:hypothetical protein
MDAARRHGLAIAVGCVSALLAVYVGDAARLPVLMMLSGLAYWALRRPASALLASLPLVFMIHPTPVALGWRELGFAGVLAAGGVSSLWHSREVILHHGKRVWWYGLATAGLLGVNLATAIAHGVTVADWLRGVIPFAFLLYLIPVFLESRRDVTFAAAWFWAAFATAALFSWHVLSFYVSQELWQPYSYVFQEGRWIRLGTDDVQASNLGILQFRARVTQLLQQATDVLLPLGYVWGLWLFLRNQRWPVSAAGAALAVVATVAMVLTYTRSMLLAAWLVGGLILLRALVRRAFKRVAVAAMVTIVTTFVTIAAFDLGDIYLNRLVLLQQAAKTMSSIEDTDTSSGASNGGEAGAMPEEAIKDANVTSRLEEYRLAWDMFGASPLLGQGLGVRHDISFETGHGDVIVVRVGYVHNWVFYILMVGGLVGFAAYAAALFGPAVAAFRSTAIEQEWRDLIVATVLVLAVYGLFFAVFRLIPFNLLLGGLWGVVLAVPHRAAATDGGA